MSSKSAVTVTVHICKDQFQFDGIVDHVLGVFEQDAPTPPRDEIFDDTTASEVATTKTVPPDGIIHKKSPFGDYIEARIISQADWEDRKGMAKDVAITLGWDIAIACGLRGKIIWKHLIDFNVDTCSLKVSMPCSETDSGKKVCNCGFTAAEIDRQFHGIFLIRPNTSIGGAIPKPNYEYPAESVNQSEIVGGAYSGLMEVREKKKKSSLSANITLQRMASKMAYDMAFVLKKVSYYDADGKTLQAKMFAIDPAWTYYEDAQGRVPIASHDVKVQAEALRNHVLNDPHALNMIVLNKYDQIGFSAFIGYKDSKAFIYYSIVVGSQVVIEEEKEITCSTPQEVRSRGYLPGEQITLNWIIRDKGLLKKIPVAVARFYTHALTGGYIREVVGDYGLPAVRYKVEVYGDEDHLHTIMPTDMVEYEVGDWVYLIRKTPSGVCDQEDLKAKTGEVYNTVNGQSGHEGFKDIVLPEDPHSSSSLKSVDQSSLSRFGSFVDSVAGIKTLIVDPDICPSDDFYITFTDPYQYTVSLVENAKFKPISFIPKLKHTVLAYGDIRQDCAVGSFIYKGPKVVDNHNGDDNGDDYGSDIGELTKSYMIIQKSCWKYRMDAAGGFAAGCFLILKIRKEPRTETYRILPLGLIDGIGA